jgi:hypothetical protein
MYMPRPRVRQFLISSAQQLDIFQGSKAPCLPLKSFMKFWDFFDTTIALRRAALVIRQYVYPYPSVPQSFLGRMRFNTHIGRQQIVLDLSRTEVMSSEFQVHTMAVLHSSLMTIHMLFDLLWYRTTSSSSSQNARCQSDQLLCPKTLTRRHALGPNYQQLTTASGLPVATGVLQQPLVSEYRTYPAYVPRTHIVASYAHTTAIGTIPVVLLWPF